MIIIVNLENILLLTIRTFLKHILAIIRVCLPTRVILIDRGSIVHLCVWCVKIEQVASTVWLSISKSCNLRVWQQVIESCNKNIERAKHMSADWKWVNNNKACNCQYVNANVAGSAVVTTTIEEETHGKNMWKGGNRH